MVWSDLILWHIHYCRLFNAKSFIYIYNIYLYIYNLSTHFIDYILDIGLMVTVFTNGPGDLGSIPGRVIPKTQKMVLDATLFNTQHYKVRIKVKWSNSGKGVVPSPTPWCSSYRKGSLQVTLNYGRQLYLLIIFLNEPELICLHTVKLFQVLQCNSNNLTSVICLHTF